MTQSLNSPGGMKEPCSDNEKDRDSNKYPEANPPSLVISGQKCLFLCIDAKTLIIDVFLVLSKVMIG